MSSIHISPEEAIKVHLDLKAETSIGMHFGTFPLADDGQNDPVSDLEVAKKKFNLSDNDFRILKEGSSHEIHTFGGKEKWMSIR